MGNGSTIKTVRLLHRYLGLFFAPAIVFFALSGAMQTFGWHEAGRDGFKPPEWLIRMAQLHKKQTLNVPQPKVREDKETKAQLKPIAAEVPPVANKKNSGQDKSKFALKCFVFAMSLSLMLTTILGVIMAFRYGGSPRVVCGVVLLGSLFPVAVVLL